MIQIMSIHLAVVSLNVSLDDVGGGRGVSDGQQVLHGDRLYCSTLHLHNFAGFCDINL